MHCNVYLSVSVGTFQIRSEELIGSVLHHALEAGYRHIGEFSFKAPSKNPTLNN